MLAAFGHPRPSKASKRRNRTFGSRRWKAASGRHDCAGSCRRHGHDNPLNAPGEPTHHPAGDVGRGIDKSVLSISASVKKRTLDLCPRKLALSVGVSLQIHIIFGPRNLGRSAVRNDEFTVPLCRTRHREVHR
jgi:hypothetical protein